MRASDRLARFVGLEAYELAGGGVVRDLFDAEAVYVEDPALMAQLAEKKLEGEWDSWLAQGWGWVENSLGQGRVDGAMLLCDFNPTGASSRTKKRPSLRVCVVTWMLWMPRWMMIA